MTSHRRRIAASRRKKETGSPKFDEPVFLAIGRLQRPHGVHGEVLMGVMTDFPERIAPKVTLYLGEARQPVEVRSVRQHAKGLLLSLQGYSTREQVGSLRNQILYVHAGDRPELPEGEYYHHQMLGLRVVAEGGEVLGVLMEIIETGANDVYVVRRQTGSDVLLPATDEVILKVDLEAGELQVRLLPGLLP